LAHSSLNPYQPPVINMAETGVAAGDFTIARALSDGWNAAKRYFPLCLGVGLVSIVISVVAALTIIGYFLVLPVLAYGAIKFLLNMLDGKPEFNDLFSGFSNYGTVLGRMLLLILIMVLIALVSESAMLAGMYSKSEVIQLIGSLIYLASFVFVILPLSFSYYFVVDQDMTAAAALSASWRVTRGKLGKLVGLTLLAVLISWAGLLALVVGVFFTMAVAYGMFASAYRQLAGPAPASALAD
jgi:hypothetical protein